MCAAGAGTPAFQAPELASGVDYYHGFKVDMWAVGVSLCVH